MDTRKRTTRWYFRRAESEKRKTQKKKKKDSPRDTNTDHYKHPNPLCWPHAITTNLYQRSGTARLPVNGGQ